MQTRIIDLVEWLELNPESHVRWYLSKAVASLGKLTNVALPICARCLRPVSRV